MKLDDCPEKMKTRHACLVLGIHRSTFFRHRGEYLRAGVRFTQVHPGRKGERILRDSLRAYLAKQEAKRMKRLTPDREAINARLLQK
jgi:hypothetical protein